MTERANPAIMFQSKPSFIEAVQHTGEVTNPWALDEFAPGKVRIDPDTGTLELLAGTEGVQGWVPVPLYHWLVRQPGDPSDVWPVDPDYFAGKYEAVEGADNGSDHSTEDRP